MTQLVVQAAGAVVGYFVGGGPQGAAIGWALAGAAATLLEPDKNVFGPRLEELRFSRSSYGAAVPIVVGAVRVGANIIWIGEVEEVAAKKKAGKNAYQTSFSYRQSFAAALCEGEVAGVRRIWFDNQLVYSTVASDAAAVLRSGEIEALLTVYKGTSTQLPDAVMEAEEGAGNVPAYRDVCYIVLERLDLTAWGNRIPSVTAEVVEAGDYSAPQRISTNAVMSGAGVRVDGASVLSSDTGLKSRKLTWRSFDGDIVSEVVCTASEGFVATDRIASPFLYVAKNEPAIAYAYVTDDAPNHPVPAYIRGVWTVASGGGLLVFNGVEPATELGAGDLVVLGGYLFGFFGTAIHRWPLVVDSATGAKVPSLGANATFDFTSLGAISGSSGGNLATDGQYLYARHNEQTGDKPIHRFDVDLVHLEEVGAPSPSLKERHFAVFDRMVLGFSAWFAGTGYTVSQWRMNGDGTLTLMPGALADSTTATGGYLAQSGALVFTGGVAEYSMVPDLVPSGRTIGQAITALCGRAGVASGDIDVTDCVATLRGFVVDRRMPARAALEPLLGAFAIDAVESAGKVKFVVRGKAPAAEVAAADCGAAHSTDGDRVFWSRTREQQNVLPQAVAVQYMDADAAYEIGSQEARRGEPVTEQQLSIALPVVLTAAEAAKIAHRWLYDAWAARAAREFTTSLQHAPIEPTDVIWFVDGDSRSRERVVNKSDDDGILRWETVSDDDGVLIQVAAGGALPPPATFVPPSGASLGIVFEAPPLRDEHAATLALYAAAAPHSSPWPGATAWVNTPGNTDLVQAGEITEPGIVGQAMTALPARSATQGQADPSTLDVRLTGGAPATATESEWLGGRNLLYVGGELVRFRAQAPITGGYRLSGLLRHQHGTDYAGSSHVAGEQVALLDDLDAAHLIARPSVELGASRHWRTPTIGSQVLDAPAMPFILLGRTLRPLSPVHVNIVRQANGDRTIRWHRRTRAWQEWREAADIPLLEAPEQYVISILNAASGAVVRAATVTEASFTYTAAQIAADWTPLPPVTVRVRVAQVSPLVGVGDYADVIIPWAGDYNATYQRDFNEYGTAGQSVSGVSAFGLSPVVVSSQPSGGGWPSGARAVNVKNNNGAQTDAKARFDDVPAFKDGTLRWTTPKIYNIFGTSKHAGMVARTTYWRNNTVGFGYLVNVYHQPDASYVRLGYGDNADSGSYTQVAAASLFTTSTDVSEFIWQMSGTSHKVWVDGTLRLNVTNGAISVAGQCGLWLYGDFEQSADFDNVRIDFN